MIRTFIPVYEPSISEKEVEYVTSAVKSGWVSSTGEFVSKFEQEFAKFVGTRYAVSVANGTVALHLALLACGIGPGDEVIVPDLTFIATANAVAYCGAKPVFADVEYDTWCIDPADVERKVTKKTKAIIPVHLYGHPANMEAITEIANRYGLYVIEDCAEAHGAEYKGRKVGSTGHIGVFSFYGNKIITTGEGGMLTTNDERLYERAKFLKDHAMSKEKRYYHPEIGYNYRMTNLQAALGVAQLERIEELISKKLKVFEHYKNLLQDVEGIRLNPRSPWAKSVYWMVSIVLEEDFGISRDGLMAKLKDKGIDTRPFFYPLSSMPMYGGAAVNPVARVLSQNGLNLPSGPNLTEEEIYFIAETLKKILNHSI